MIDVEKITNEHLEQWKEILIKQHATPVVLFGIGEDYNDGRICLVTNGDISNEEIKAFLWTAFCSIEIPRKESGSKKYSHRQELIFDEQGYPKEMNESLKKYAKDNNGNLQVEYMSIAYASRPILTLPMKQLKLTIQGRTQEQVDMITRRLLSELSSKNCHPIFIKDIMYAYRK